MRARGSQALTLIFSPWRRQVSCIVFQADDRHAMIAFGRQNELDRLEWEGSLPGEPLDVAV